MDLQNKTDFILNNYNLILDVVNSSHRWDLLELLLENDSEHYMAIANIWYDVAQLYKTTYTWKGILGSFVSLGTVFLIQYGKLQLYAVLNNEEYRIEFSKQRNQTEDYSLEGVNAILRFYNLICIDFINISQGWYVIYSIWFKTTNFQQEFSYRVSLYLYQAVKENSLSPEFINYLYQFCQAI